MMNFRWTIGTLGLTLALMGSAAQAENPDHMRQLLSTGDCPGCDLSETSLTGFALQEANLQGANLSGSRLQTVDLTRANLTNANLSGAYLNGVNLTGANLTGANLSDATNVFICDSSVLGYTVGGADNLEECVTELIPLQVLPELCAEEPELAVRIASEYGETEEVCSEEVMAEIALYSTYASFQLFTKPLQLRGANFSDANLTNANLLGADLHYATLNNTEAAGADFSYARMFDTDVTGLLNADLDQAWESWEAVGEWMIAAKARREERAAREAGKIYIGAMGRAQQAYYLEMDKFSTDLDSLGLGISEEYEQLQFGILEPERSDRIVQYVLPRNGDQPSFLGVVSVEIEPDTDYPITSSAICESETLEAIAVADLPEIEASDDSFNCPAGWNLID